MGIRSEMRVIVRKECEDWANPSRFVKPSQPRAKDQDSGPGT